MSAYQELIKRAGCEPLEAVVIGAYGWGTLPSDYQMENDEYEDLLGFGEDMLGDHIIPFNKRGIVLDAEQAKPLLQHWSCYGGYGSPTCYAITAWTASWVMWITQYDGATSIDRAPRNPLPYVPEMPGG